MAQASEVAVKAVAQPTVFEYVVLGYGEDPWDKWVKKWNDRGLCLPERKSLLHGVFDLHGLTIEEEMMRLGFCMKISHLVVTTVGRDDSSRQNSELAKKALNVLFQQLARPYGTKDSNVGLDCHVMQGSTHSFLELLGDELLLNSALGFFRRWVHVPQDGQADFNVQNMQRLLARFVILPWSLRHDHASHLVISAKRTSFVRLMCEMGRLDFLVRHLSGTPGWLHRFGKIDDDGMAAIEQVAMSLHCDGSLTLEERAANGDVNAQQVLLIKALRKVPSVASSAVAE